MDIDSETENREIPGITLRSVDGRVAGHPRGIIASEGDPETLRSVQELVARPPAAVMITGDSGTGKE